MFTRPGYRLGDSWTFFHQDTYHLFYLTCPQEQPLHKRWDIGHASSPDAFEWTDHGEILHPGQPGAWDGICPATGSVTTFEGEFWMAYTGNYAGPEPTTGLARSIDLFQWEKIPDNPVTRADGTRYSTEPNLVWGQPKWRDPYLFPHDGWIYQLITAGLPQPPHESSGTVACARSRDMRQWELATPLQVPRLAQDLECPKLYHLDDRYHLIISISQRLMSPDFLARQPRGVPVNTAFSLVADHFAGPYHLHGNGRILPDDSDTWPYACEVIFLRDQPHLIGTIWDNDAGDRICDPIPLQVTKQGLRATG
jgi:beta-fructofuranosidase